eukprot:2530896-Rhodomonas_salina.1
MRSCYARCGTNIGYPATADTIGYAATSDIRYAATAHTIDYATTSDIGYAATRPTAAQTLALFFPRRQVPNHMQSPARPVHFVPEMTLQVF